MVRISGIVLKKHLLEEETIMSRLVPVQYLIMILTMIETIVKQLCTVEWNIDHSKLYLEQRKKGIAGVKYREPRYDLHILLGGAIIDFSIIYKDKKVAYIQAKYKEEF